MAINNAITSGLEQTERRDPEWLHEYLRFHDHLVRFEIADPKDDVRLGVSESRDDF